MQHSRFDGGLLSYIAHSLLAGFIIFITLGIFTPWAIVLMYRWKTRHTIIDGHRLQFNGTAIGLFGHWIKWFFLTLITFGIYGFWLQIKLEQWKVRHTTTHERVFATALDDELDF